MDDVFRNVRHSVRALKKRPGFTAIVVLTLGLGIGATTAIFSVVRNVLLRPLPYDEPHRIVQVWNPWSNEPGVVRGRSAMSSLDVTDARDAVGSFEFFAAYAPQTSVNLTGGERPERVLLTQTSADLFPVLGTSALIGRTFSVEDDAPGRNDVVVLSYALWQRRFGGDRSALESVVSLDGVAHRVIGVMPPSFRVPADYLREEPTEVWKPLGLGADDLDRGNQWLHGVARLRPGATLARANAELESLTQHWIEQGFKITDLPPYYAVPIEEELFGGSRRALLILFGAVTFVLLIACANVANLLLARADGRRTEMAVRTALGAGRSRIVSQLLAESLVLAVIGGVLGLLLAWAGVELLIALEPGNVPRIDEVRIDPATLGFTAAVVLATAGIFGLVPALHASRPDPAVQLRIGSRAVSGGRGGGRVRGALTVAEVALSVVLVIGATLLIRTFAELSRVDLGFAPERVLTFAVALPVNQYAAAEDRVRFFTQLAERLQQLPGVRFAGGAETLPLTRRLGGGSIELEGAEPPRPGEGLPNTRWQVVTPGYFEAMGYTLTAGRLLESTDRATAAPVVVVNETMAEMFWPGRSDVGGRVRNANADVPWFTVVGVVQDVRHSGLVDRPSPTMYFGIEQVPLTRRFTPAAMTFALQTASASLGLADPVRQAVASLDPGLPVVQLRTMDTIVDDALAQPRFTMLLLAIFAAVALAMAIIGIYGLLSYTVSQQWRDIGIRVALGAPNSSVFSLIVWKGMRLALIGLGAGLVAAVFLAGLMERLLYGVQPLDPLTFAAVPALFAGVAFAATWLPAYRATAVDPVLALRQQ
ncbi:MAG TPA: ABC transporter permease [Longimicrobiales bacterium]